MDYERIIAFIAIIIAPITATITWQLGRRKQNAETDSSIAEGANLAVDTMTQVLTELRTQVAQLKIENEALRRQVGELHMEVEKLRRQIT